MIGRDGIATLDEHVVVLAALTKLEKHRSDPAVANDDGRAVLRDVVLELAQQKVHVLCRHS